MFDSIDLVKELKKSKPSEGDSQITLLSEAKSILLQSELDERKGLKELLRDKENIFTSDQIKQICIRYRLRFLDLNQFKGDVPAEAQTKLNRLQSQKNIRLRNLKVVAPASLFELEDKDSDPLLLMQVGNNAYYFIHKWGKDLSWHRLLTSYIFRSLNHFIVFLVLAAWIFAQLMPIAALPGVGDNDGVFSIYRWYLFSFTLIGFCSLSVLLLFSFHKNFSDLEWQSKYLS